MIDEFLQTKYLLSQISNAKKDILAFFIFLTFFAFRLPVYLLFEVMEAGSPYLKLRSKAYSPPRKGLFGILWRFLDLPDTLEFRGESVSASHPRCARAAGARNSMWMLIGNSNMVLLIEALD